MKKFRAFYEKSQTWVYFEIGQHWTDEGRKIYSDLCIDGVTFYEFTGLKDKNGKEIYESDIVIIDTISNRKRLITFKNGCFSVSLKSEGKVKAMYPMFEFDTFEQNEYEVIGNIHENPELL